MDAEIAENPRAVIGANNPPADPTPFELSKAEIEDLRGEAENWLDGKPVETQAEADMIGKIITDMRAALKRADDRRVIESQPFDDGKAEIQARYNPLISKTGKKGLGPLTIEVCKAAVDGFMAREDARKQAIAEELRREAETRQRIAEEAIRASNPANIAERERAELLVERAKIADKAATKAERDKATIHGGGRAITSRKEVRPALVDAKAAARHAWTAWRPELEEFLVTMAKRDFDAGRRDIPGFEAIEVRIIV